MATRFEALALGEPTPRLLAALDEALDEVELAERRLSRFLPESEVSELNAVASTRPVKVSPGMFDILKVCAGVWQTSDGLFDVTVGPLVDVWNTCRKAGATPSEDEVQQALQVVGFSRIQADEPGRRVHFTAPGMRLDLGAVGKGYALNMAARTLLDCGVDRGLIHGGTSTVVALEAPEPESGWKIEIAGPEDYPGTIGVVSLKNQALSVSAVHGRSFMHEGRRLGHVIDPRTGWPVSRALVAAVVAGDALLADALSTALLAMGPEGMEKLHLAFPSVALLCGYEENGSLHVQADSCFVLA